jgi:hypothetical protein
MKKNNSISFNNEERYRLIDSLTAQYNGLLRCSTPEQLIGDYCEAFDCTEKQALKFARTGDDSFYHDG